MKLPFLSKQADGIQVYPYKKAYEKDLIKLMQSVFWEDNIIKGQIKAFARALNEKENHLTLVAKEGKQIVGYVVAEYNEWNRLGQIHGLVVDPSKRRNKIATILMAEAESFVKRQGGRGIHAGTPAENGAGRLFYESNQYSLDYQMTEYFDKGKHGVTYLKLFDETVQEVG